MKNNAIILVVVQFIFSLFFCSCFLLNLVQATGRKVFPFIKTGKTLGRAQLGSKGQKSENNLGRTILSLISMPPIEVKMTKRHLNLTYKSGVQGKGSRLDKVILELLIFRRY